jgi:hypothetical protein
MLKNNLETEVDARSSTLSRRDFLKGTIGGYFVGIALACGGKGPGPGPTPITVTLNFNVYNASKGLAGSFSKTVNTGDSVALRVSDFGVGGVDPQRFVVRRRNNGQDVGGYVINSYTGSTSIGASSAITDYDIWLFNAGNVDYSKADEVRIGLGLPNGRTYNIRREDQGGQTGPEYVFFGMSPDGIPGVINQVNGAMNPFGIKYGSRAWLGNSGSAPVTAGYAPSGAMGTHGPGYWTINAAALPSDSAKIGIGLAEDMENMLGFNNYLGQSTHNTTQLYGVLNDVGKDLVIYGMLMSPG